MVKYFVLIVWISAAVHGQDLRFNTPRRLSSNINSPCEELLPIVSVDGSTLYFLRINCEANTGGKFAGADIWRSDVSTQTSQWSKSVNTGLFKNTNQHNAIVGVGQGGDIYQFNAGASKSTSGIYWISGLDALANPKRLPFSFLQSQTFLGVYITPDTSLILLSMNSGDSKGEEDLYVSLKNSIGEWTSPKNLGPVINTKGFEISPFLSADKTRLYFSSNGHKGLGDADIFYSDRLDESWEKWSDPVNVVILNSPNFDAYFSLHDTVAYFCSNQNGQFSDIYIASIKANKQPPGQEKEIARMIAEAKSLLQDIRGDARDSVVYASRSMFISFHPNSTKFEDVSFSDLDAATLYIRRENVGKIRLVGYTNEENSILCKKRMEAVKQYFEEIPTMHLTLETELINERNTIRNRDGLVEIRYE